MGKNLKEETAGPSEREGWEEKTETTAGITPKEEFNEGSLTRTTLPPSRTKLCWDELKDHNCGYQC